MTESQVQAARDRFEAEMEAQIEKEAEALRQSRQWSRGRRHFATPKEKQAQAARELLAVL